MSYISFMCPQLDCEETFEEAEKCTDEPSGTLDNNIKKG